MHYQFRPIVLEDKTIMEPYFQAGQYENSELCFGNLFLWKEASKLEVCPLADMLLIRGRLKDGRRFYFPPVMREFSRIAEGMDHCIEACRQEQEPFLMYGVNERIMQLLLRHCPDCFSITEDRNNFDYVYNTSDLITLQGSKYHAKRNHINKMRATIDADYVRMSDELVEACFASYMIWYEKRQTEGFDPSLEDEKQAVRAALDYWKELELDGGALLINGSVEAFSLGERCKHTDTAIIHIEKANTDYPGLYALINQQTAQNVFSDVQFLNREEDMGIPGLRRAKESYHPCKMIRKFIVRLA